MSPNLQRGGIVLSTSEKKFRSENLIQFNIVAITMQCNDQETVYIFTIPPLYYIYFY